MPSYQTTAVQQYLSTASGLPNSSKYNKSGRAYPDVSAQSEGFVIIQFGFEMPVRTFLVSQSRSDASSSNHVSG